MGKTEDKGTVITCPLEDLRPRRAEQSLGLAGAGQAGLGHGTERSGHGIRADNNANLAGLVRRKLPALRERGGRGGPLPTLLLAACSDQSLPGRPAPCLLGKRGCRRLDQARRLSCSTPVSCVFLNQR